MTPYLAVAGLLVAIALFDAAVPRCSRQCAWASLLLVTGFAALRYQTGYDWPVYEDFFDKSATFETALYHGVPAQDLPMEPLFQGLNMLVKSIGGSFIFLLAMIAIFNCLTIHSVTSRISASQSQMWMLYFALAFPIAQLSILRQSLAASFVLIALLLAVQRRLFVAIAALLVGIGFHSSAAIFAPLLFVYRVLPSFLLVALGMGVGVALLAADVRAINPIIDAMLPLLPAWLSDKLPFYQQSDPAQITAAVAALIAWHCCILFLLYDEVRRGQRDEFLMVAIWLTFLVLAAHIYFAGFPNLWNRIMCVSLPWQLASVWRTQRLATISTGARLVLIAGVGAAAMGGLLYTLAKPESSPLVPYHSLLQVWFYDSQGDGRQRSEDWMTEYESMIQGKPGRQR